MAIAVSNGIASIKFTKPGLNGAFPTTWDGKNSATLHNFKFINPDSVNENKDDDQTEDFRVEDVEGVFLSVTTEVGKKTFTLETVDLSDETLKYFLGHAKVTETNANKDYYLAPVTFDMEPQAMQIVDKKIGGYDARIWEYMPCKVEAKIEGAIGKKHLRKLTLKVTQMANFDESGKQIPNMRWKPA